MSPREKSLPVLQTLNGILHECRVLESRLATYPYGMDGDPDVSLDLLRLLYAADDLLGYVADPTVGFRGPLGGQNPLQFHHRHRPPHWDFATWFGEKASEVKRAAKSLVRLHLRELQERDLASTAPLPSGEPLRDSLTRELKTVQAYAQVIFDMIADEGLIVEEEDQEEMDDD